MRGWRRVGIALAATLLAGCAASPTGPALTPTLVATPVRQTTASACPTGGPAVDDRTSARGFVQSYYDAVNRGDWPRAYGYFTPRQPSAAPPTPAEAPPPFAAWQQSFAGILCVLVRFDGLETVVNDVTPGFAGIGTGLAVPVTITEVLAAGGEAQLAGMVAVRYDPTVGVADSGALDPEFTTLNPI